MLLNKLVSPLSVALVVLGARSSNCIPAQAQSLALKPLSLYWGAERGDNFVTATSEGRRGAIAAGYSYVRVEACVLSQPVAGSVPFNLYWSENRGDNFTTATKVGKDSAIVAGYAPVRTEGYVFWQLSGAIA